MILSSLLFRASRRIEDVGDAVYSLGVVVDGLEEPLVRAWRCWQQIVRNATRENCGAFPDEHQPLAMCRFHPSDGVTSPYDYIRMYE